MRRRRTGLRSGTSSGRRGAARRRPGGDRRLRTTGRIEKGYRAYGSELESEYNVAEAGMTRPKVKEHDFLGKKAYLRHREEEPAAIMSTLTVDDPTSSSGVKRYMMGREPILTADGERIVDRKGRPSYVTTAGSGPSVGKHVLMATAARRGRGKQPLVQYMGELSGDRNSPAARSSTRRTRGSGLNARRRHHHASRGGARITLTADEREIDTSYLGRSARTRNARSRRRCGSWAKLRRHDDRGDPQAAGR
jgi:hypothetical protein